VRVTAAGTKHVSMAALICTRSGQRTRLIYRIHLDRGPAKGRRKGFTETDYARLLDAAHQQLGGPILLVGDNLNTHVSRIMRELVDARLWLTVYQLPPCAPEFNPGEGVWSHLKRSLANLIKHSLEQLTALVKTRLSRSPDGVRFACRGGAWRIRGGHSLVQARRRRRVVRCRFLTVRPGPAGGRWCGVQGAASGGPLRRDQGQGERPGYCGPVDVAVVSLGGSGQVARDVEHGTQSEQP
jgi:transposase